MILQGKAKYPVTEAILHCAASNTGQFSGMTPFQVFLTINRWHRERGFKSFGYHGLFMPDGRFYSGHPFFQIGAHCIERNRGSLGFLLIEGQTIDRMGFFHDWFTSAQGSALRLKLAQIPGIQKVSGHNEYAQKLCPGFNVRSRDFLNVA